MDIKLVRPEGKPLKCSMPYDGADFVLCEALDCCGSRTKLRGAAQEPSADDRAWEADAYTVCCRKHVGRLRVEVSTIFGVREDQAILSGRVRVY